MALKETYEENKIKISSMFMSHKNYFYKSINKYSIENKNMQLVQNRRNYTF
jgi:hypothetical protein